MAGKTTAFMFLIPAMLILLSGALILPHPVRAATTVTLSSSAQTESTTTLAWSQSTDSFFTSYTIYYSTTGTGGPWYSLWSTTNKTQTSTFVSGLSYNAAYWFYVVDRDAYGTADSNVIQVTTKKLPLLQIASTTDTTVTLSWTDYNTYSSLVPFDSFAVQTGPSAVGPWSTLAIITNRSQTTYVAMGLSPGHTNHFVVSDQVGTTGNLQNSYSNPVNYTGPLVTISVLETTIDAGQSMLIASSTVGGNAPLQYQWYMNGNPIPSATATTCMFSPPSSGVFGIYVAVKDSTGSLATSNTLSMNVNAAPSVVISASATTLTLGQEVQLTASVSGGTSPFGYQWYTNGSPVEGATSTVFNILPSATGTYVIKAVIQDSVGASASSNEVTIGVYHTLTSLVLSAPAVADVGDSIGMTAKLTDMGGHPISGQTITFSVSGVAIGSAPTDSSGTASISYTVTVGSGSYAVKADYAGSSTYSPSSASGTLVVHPFYLTVIAGIPDAHVVTVNGTTYLTDASGRVQVPIGERGTYEVGIVSPFVIDAGTRVVFVQWSDGTGANPRSVMMDSNKTFTATTKTQYTLTVQGPSGSTTGGAGWYDANSQANVTAGFVWDAGASSRYRLSSYELDGGSSVGVSGNEVGSYSHSVRMDSPHAIVFLGTRQFLVTVTSQYGTVTGAGWYDANSTAHFSVSPSSVSAGFLASNVFAGWSGDSTAKTSQASVLVDSPITVTANWTTDSSQLYIAIVGIVVVVAAAGIFVFLRSRRR